MFEVTMKTSDPYDSCIRHFVMKSFPSKVVGSSSNMVNLVSDEVFATKSVRLGPKPSPEVQVAIRDVIRR